MNTRANIRGSDRWAALEIRLLAAFVAVVGVAFIIPYLQLQLTGLGIIVEVASFDAIGRTPAMLIAVASATLRFRAR